MDIESLIKVLQTSITPAVLISGFGLLMLSMTNRLGRVIDRVRLLHANIKAADPQEKSKIEKQISILFERCQLLQTAITLISFGVFLISITVFLLFLVFILKSALIEQFIKVTFGGSLLCLIASLFFFILDIRLTLASLKIEISENH